MPEDLNQYQNPSISRYASRQMSDLWSPQRKFSTWRRLWAALAEAEAGSGRQGYYRHAGQLPQAVRRRSPESPGPEQLICQKMEFAESCAFTGQTYQRKIDSQVLDALSHRRSGRPQDGH